MINGMYTAKEAAKLLNMYGPQAINHHVGVGNIVPDETIVNGKQRINLFTIESIEALRVKLTDQDNAVGRGRPRRNPLPAKPLV